MSDGKTEGIVGNLFILFNLVGLKFSPVARYLLTFAHARGT